MGNGYGMKTGSKFDGKTVLPGWARSMITKVPKLIKYDKGFRDPRLVEGMPGDIPLVPHGRFMVETDERGVLAITSMPSWQKDEPLKEPKPLVSVRAADRKLLLDPGFTYGDIDGNTRKLLLMFLAKGWDGAMAWILEHSDIRKLGKWSAMSDSVGGRCEPLGLLSQLAERGGPDHACRRYMTIINRKCSLSMDAFPIIEMMCSKTIGPDWEKTIPTDLNMDSARLHALNKNPALIVSMSRVLHLALTRDGDADVERVWQMIAGLVGGESDDLLRLADHLDDDRAGFVALSMLHTQSVAKGGGRWNTPMLPGYRSNHGHNTINLGDVCLSEWNPFNHMRIQDEKLFESPAVKADMCAWIDSTASMHSEGVGMGVERVHGMADAAMDVIQISMDAVDSSTRETREPGRRSLDGIPLVALTKIMNGDEPEGARALAKWVGANRNDATGMRDVILSAMRNLMYSHEGKIIGTRESVGPILRMFRIATHWIHDGGGIDDLMSRAAKVRDLDYGGCDPSLILQAWVEGPDRDYPLGFLWESMCIED